MGKWDLGLDYTTTRKQLVRELKRVRNFKGARMLRKRMYLMILLTQLDNGSRVGEAIEFLGKVYRTGERKGEVRVEKRKDEKTRLMVLPKEITKNDLLETRGVYDELCSNGRKSFVSAVSMYARRDLGINTHSLRYAFITHLGRLGYAPQTIANITKHKTLDQILNYTQEKLAEEILLKLTGYD